MPKMEMRRRAIVEGEQRVALRNHIRDAFELARSSDLPPDRPDVFAGRIVDPDVGAAVIDHDDAAVIERPDVADPIEQVFRWAVERADLQYRLCCELPTGSGFPLRCRAHQEFDACAVRCSEARSRALAHAAGGSQARDEEAKRATHGRAPLEGGRSWSAILTRNARQARIT